MLGVCLMMAAFVYRLPTRAKKQNTLPTTSKTHDVRCTLCRRALTTANTDMGMGTEVDAGTIRAVGRMLVYVMKGCGW